MAVDPFLRVLADPATFAAADTGGDGALSAAEVRPPEGAVDGVCRGMDFLGSRKGFGWSVLYAPSF